MSHLVRRSTDERRLVCKGVLRVFDMLDTQKDALGITSIAVGKVSMRGGSHCIVKIHKANGREVIFTANGSGQRQEIRTVTTDQQRTMERAARAFRKANISIRFQGACNDGH